MQHYLIDILLPVLKRQIELIDKARVNQKYRCVLADSDVCLMCKCAVIAHRIFYGISDRKSVV